MLVKGKDGRRDQELQEWHALRATDMISSNKTGKTEKILLAPGP